MSTRINQVALTGTLIIMACLVPPKAEAQSIARRVSTVRDGKVRMSFAAKDDICGYNDGIQTGWRNNGDSRSSWSSNSRSEDVVYDSHCSEGPVRVVLTMNDGHVERVKTYVGGQWRANSGATDLGTVSVREATDFLLGVAGSESGKGAGEAIFPVTIADSTDAVQPLYALGKNRSRPIEVRDQAIFWLSQEENDRAVGMLEDILKNADDKRVADKAIFGLSQHHSGKGYATLRSYAENDDVSDELRDKAIFWLGQSRSGNAHNYLTGLYSRVGSSKLKDKIIFSVAQQKSEESGKWLLDVVSNRNESLAQRKSALFWAGQEGASMSQLASLYSRMDSKEMKDQMIFVLSQRHEKAALDKLMDIARNDPDRDARKKAMFWLGQSRDPRVSEFLSDVINR